jgi:hypothetical protein
MSLKETDQAPDAAIEAEGEFCVPFNAADQIEICYAKGWTDGLPVVPASPLAMGAMLEAAGLAADEIVAEMPSRNVRIPADKVAINAVMAGCLPEYMPVVVAAVKCLAHPEFGLHHVGAAHSGPTVGVIVNGPIAAALGINSGDNVLGPGFRANATIGRAVRLVMLNCLNYRPGIADRATLGTSGKFTCCLAENEETSPWAPLHVERGFAPEVSTVTLVAWSTAMLVSLHTSAEQLLIGIADAFSYSGNLALVGQTPGMVIFAGEHMETLKADGWTKARVREFVVGNARRRVADLKRAGRCEAKIAARDADSWYYAMERPEDLMVLAAGGPSGAFSAVLPGFGSSQTAGRSRTIAIAP